MSALSLRLPDSLHETAKALAKKEHVSVNQLIATAFAVDFGVERDALEKVFIRHGEDLSC